MAPIKQPVWVFILYFIRKRKRKECKRLRLRIVTLMYRFRFYQYMQVPDIRAWPFIHALFSTLMAYNRTFS